MRLYSLTNATAVDDPVYGHYEPDPEHGGFDFADELADRLHGTHYRKKRAWETQEERDQRLHGEERDRRRDPETLYNAVADIAGITRQLAGLQLSGAQAAALDPEAEEKALRERLAELEAQRAKSSASATPARGPRGRSKDA